MGAPMRPAWLCRALLCARAAGLALEAGHGVGRGPAAAMHRAFVVGTNREACPGYIADLGVRASVEAMAEECEAHLERIQVQTVPMPSVKPFHALVNVKWSSVNPCNWKRFVTTPLGGFVLGNDFAGIVTQVGALCDFAPGDRVWGMADGTYQEYVNVPCSPQSPVSKVPAGVGLEQAGVLGVTGTTGLGSLLWAGAPWSSSPTVLVIGGSSGTGHVGIQLARAFGAGKVITTASASNMDFVRRIGADEVIDYHAVNWWEVLDPGSVDVIYDCVCLAGTGDHAYDVLADNGAFVTIQMQSKPSNAAIRSRPSIRQLHHIGLPSDRAALLDLGDLLARGQLNSTVESVFLLDQIPEAFEHAMEGHTAGKIALQIS